MKESDSRAQMAENSLHPSYPPVDHAAHEVLRYAASRRLRISYKLEGAGRLPRSRLMAILKRVRHGDAIFLRGRV